jgi:hypothetical protein
MPHDGVASPIHLAVRAKGRLALLKRVWTISRRYGLTPTRMDRALADLLGVLKQFDCGATFPITAVALFRNGAAIRKYQAQGIEFAVHGYRHIDHSQLPLEQQSSHLDQAAHVFAKADIRFSGFRCPYLRWNADTLTAIRRQRLTYDSSQALAWDVLGGCETASYRRVLDFCNAQSATDYPALPRLEGDLVRIPYCLPDDEALVDRLQLADSQSMSQIWLEILHRTYQLGELFTLGLHPERIDLCQVPLTATLREARSLSPAVWIARLGEIAAWWRARRGASVVITDIGESRLRVTIDGPIGITVLARAVKVDAPAILWADGYQRVEAIPFIIRAPHRPFIGISPRSAAALSDFLRQQGYIVEISEKADRYSYYFNQADFAAERQRSILAQIEETDRPLVRLGRWPNGTRSALAVTGDIDALTIWDYGLRLVGR